SSIVIVGPGVGVTKRSAAYMGSSSIGLDFQECLESDENG
ncbi:hypothetical protein Tco_1498681, partial [Tanacetum coccineum]